MKKINWLQIIVTAILSLIVGYVLFVVEKKELGLTYQVIENTTFSGEKENALIYTVTFKNDGELLIENIQGIINVSFGNIEDYEVDISKAIDYTILSEPEILEFSLPYLNPNEEFTFSILAIDNVFMPQMDVDIRGSGIVGYEEEATINKFQTVNIIANLIEVTLFFPILYLIFKKKKS